MKLVAACLAVACAMCGGVALAFAATGNTRRPAHRARSEIRIGVGIGQVTLGALSVRVEAQIGRPDAFAAPNLYYRLPMAATVGVDYWHRIDDISTTSRNERTDRGIGPGSSLSSFRRAYPRARCFRARGQGWRRVCTIASSVGGVRSDTDFLFRQHLAEVDVFAVGALPRVPGMQ